MDEDQNQSVMLAVAYLTREQRVAVTEDLSALSQRIREMSEENHANGVGDLLRAWRTAPPGTRRARISSSNMLLPVSLGE